MAPYWRAKASIFFSDMVGSKVWGASTAVPSPEERAKRLGNSCSSWSAESSVPSSAMPMVEMLVVSKPETVSTTMLEEEDSP